MTKPLAAYLFTNDSQLKQQFERNISAGGMIFNDTGIHVRDIFICTKTSLQKVFLNCC
jgi:acyl-CoA reductase-like NAD-dependent aldehyde dehydrogenase